MKKIFLLSLMFGLAFSATYGNNFCGGKVSTLQLPKTGQQQRPKQQQQVQQQTQQGAQQQYQQQPQQQAQVQARQVVHQQQPQYQQNQNAWQNNANNWQVPQFQGAQQPKYQQQAQLTTQQQLIAQYNAGFDEYIRGYQKYKLAFEQLQAAQMYNNGNIDPHYLQQARLIEQQYQQLLQQHQFILQQLAQQPQLAHQQVQQPQLVQQQAQQQPKQQPQQAQQAQVAQQQAQQPQLVQQQAQQAQVAQQQPQQQAQQVVQQQAQQNQNVEQNNANSEQQNQKVEQQELTEKERTELCRSKLEELIKVKKQFNDIFLNLKGTQFCMSEVVIEALRNEILALIQKGIKQSDDIEDLLFTLEDDDFYLMKAYYKVKNSSDKNETIDIGDFVRDCEYYRKDLKSALKNNALDDQYYKDLIHYNESNIIRKMMYGNFKKSNYHMAYEAVVATGNLKFLSVLDGAFNCNKLTEIRMRSEPYKCRYYYDDQNHKWYSDAWKKLFMGPEKCDYLGASVAERFKALHFVNKLISRLSFSEVIEFCTSKKYNKVHPFETYFGYNTDNELTQSNLWDILEREMEHFYSLREMTDFFDRMCGNYDVPWSFSTDYIMWKKRRLLNDIRHAQDVNTKNALAKKIYYKDPAWIYDDGVPFSHVVIASGNKEVVKNFIDRYNKNFEEQKEHFNKFETTKKVKAWEHVLDSKRLLRMQDRSKSFQNGTYFGDNIFVTIMHGALCDDSGDWCEIFDNVLECLDKDENKNEYNLVDYMLNEKTGSGQSNESVAWLAYVGLNNNNCSAKYRTLCGKIYKRYNEIYERWLKTYNHGQYQGEQNVLGQYYQYKAREQEKFRIERAMKEDINLIADSVVWQKEFLPY